VVSASVHDRSGEQLALMVSLVRHRRPTDPPAAFDARLDVSACVAGDSVIADEAA
jgi:hypothetical protein